MNTFFTKLFFCATILTSAALSANKASALMIMGEDVLTLSITFHTQEIDNVQSGTRYKIVEKTLNTIDVLNALAKDLGVTSNGKFGFPKGSYLVLTDKIYVKSTNGQTWDVSAYLQYTLASDVVLGHGTAPQFISNVVSGRPGLELAGVSYTSLVHVHFEDADHLADFTGFANSQPVFWPSASNTGISSASGSGMLNGKPALITAQADLRFQSSFSPLPGPILPGPGPGPIFPASSGK